MDNKIPAAVPSKNDGKNQLARNVTIALETCVRCGLCADSCHYYLAKRTPENVPAYRGEALRRSLRAGTKGKLNTDSLAEMAFASCTLCRRCVVNCPMGVDTALLMQTARFNGDRSGESAGNIGTARGHID